MSNEEDINIRERSRSYPSYNLSDSIQNADSVKKNLGSYPSTREDISGALGAERINGSTARKIASMVQFGLLRKVGAKYVLSDLYQKITHPLSPEEKLQALQEAALRPPLYCQLVERLRSSGGIPEHLRTILIRDFEVLESGADTARKIFLETVIFAGVVTPDLKFKGPTTVTSSSSPAPQDLARTPQSVSTPETHLHSAPENKSVQKDSELSEYLFNYWDTEGKTAKLYLLREMTAEDMTRLKSFLDLQIKITKKPSAGGPADG